MKRLSATVLAALATLALLALQAPPATAQQSFPLACRGGGGMVATVTTDGSIRITFTPTTQATAAVAPAAGECGWLDRGFRPSEPSLLLFTGGLDGIRYLVEVMVTGAPFVVNVFNDNQGSMVVTGFGR